MSDVENEDLLRKRDLIQDDLDQCQAFEVRHALEEFESHIHTLFPLLSHFELDKALYRLLWIDSRILDTSVIEHIKTVVFICQIAYFVHDGGALILAHDSLRDRPPILEAFDFLDFVIDFAFLRLKKQSLLRFLLLPALRHPPIQMRFLIVQIQPH